MRREEDHPRDEQGRFTAKDINDMSAAELKEYILFGDSEEKADNNGLYKKTANTPPFNTLAERMSKKHIRDVAKSVGIDLSGITLNIDIQEELLNYNITGRADYENIDTITFFLIHLKIEKC